MIENGKLRSSSGSDEHECRVTNRLGALDHLKVSRSDRFIGRPKQRVDHSPPYGMQACQRPYRQMMAQAKRVECQKSPSCPSTLVEGLHCFGVTCEPIDLYGVKIFVEELSEHVQRKQVDMEWVLKIGWGVRCQHDKSTPRSQDASNFGNMSLRVSEMFGATVMETQSIKTAMKQAVEPNA